MKLFVKNKKIFIVLVLYILLIASCSKSQAQETDESTESQSSSYKATFIELGSVKCIPCQMMQPIMEEIEEEFGDQVEVIFYDVWTEDGEPYAYQYQIQAIPTQVFLDANGNEYYRHIGFFPKEELVEILKQMGVE